MARKRAGQSIRCDELELRSGTGCEPPLLVTNWPCQTAGISLCNRYTLTNSSRHWRQNHRVKTAGFCLLLFFVLNKQQRGPRTLTSNPSNCDKEDFQDHFKRFFKVLQKKKTHYQRACGCLGKPQPGTWLEVTAVYSTFACM